MTSTPARIRYRGATYARGPSQQWRDTPEERAVTELHKRTVLHVIEELSELKQVLLTDSDLVSVLPKLQDAARSLNHSVHVLSRQHWDRW